MTPALVWLLPLSLQSLAMGFDELWYHHRRTVPRGEWRGHVLDTTVFLSCLALPLLAAPTPAHLAWFGLLAAGSCVLITKDEFVRHLPCPGGEHWLHALLFLLHPLVLIATVFLWAGPGTVLPGLVSPPAAMARDLLWVQAALVAAFLVFQSCLGAGRTVAMQTPVDNTIYERLGERWYTATDDPVALLRAEARLRTAWILPDLRAHFGQRSLAVLDVACGGGFLANPLAEAGHAVTGIDLAQDSLDVARAHDATRTVRYLPMDARRLAFPDGQFDVVCMMDFLEHLEERDEVIREAARVLKPGGWFYFHTFNRTPLAWLIAIKGVAWAVRNTPRNMHVLHLFLKPEELRTLCDRHRLALEVLQGVRPEVCTRAFLGLLVTGRVSAAFRFRFTRSLQLGYCGRAIRIANLEV